MKSFTYLLIFSFLTLYGKSSAQTYTWETVQKYSSAINWISSHPQLDSNGNAYIICLMKDSAEIDGKTYYGIPGMLNDLLLKYDKKGNIIGQMLISYHFGKSQFISSHLQITKANLDSIELEINTNDDSIWINKTLVYHALNKLRSKIRIKSDLTGPTQRVFPMDTWKYYIIGDKYLNERYVLNTSKGKYSLVRKEDTGRLVVKNYSGSGWNPLFIHYLNGKFYFFSAFSDFFGNSYDTLSMDSSMWVHRFDSTETDWVLSCIDTLGNPLFIKKIALTGSQNFFDGQVPKLAKDGNFYAHGYYYGNMKYLSKIYQNQNFFIKHLFYTSIDTQGNIRWLHASEANDLLLRNENEYMANQEFNEYTQEWHILGRSMDMTFEQYTKVCDPNSSYYLLKMDRDGKLKQFQLLFGGYTNLIYQTRMKNGRILHLCHSGMFWNGKVYGDSDRLYIYYDTVTGWVKNDPLPPLSSNEINFYPNPAHDYIYIEGKAHEPLRIYDLQGRLMHNSNSSGPLQIPVQSWPAGMYILQEGARTGKVMVVR